MVPFAADFDPESLRQPVVPPSLVIADQDINQVPCFHVEAVRTACEPRCELPMRSPEAGHEAMLSSLPPLEPDSVAGRLLAYPPLLDRSTALPLSHGRIAELFVRHLGPAM